MTEKRILRIGVRSYEEAKAQARAVVRGEASRSPDEPTAWVTSTASLAQLLSEENRRLLEIIDREQPASIGALAELAKRAQPNVSRTLAMMESYGLVEFLEGPNRQKAPRVAYDELDIVYELRKTVPAAAAATA